jgi:peptide deformylase
MRMGARVLKARAREFHDFDHPDVPRLIDDMVETMVAVRGIGLAALQVNVAKRIVVFFVPAARNGGVDIPLTVMFNPVITPVTQEVADDWESCLSVPGLTGQVPRFTAIRYAFQDAAGQLHEREAEGFHARVVQHECDHLDGLLYPMRMRDLTTLGYVQQMKAEAAERGETVDIDDEGQVAAVPATEDPILDKVT